MAGRRGCGCFPTLTDHRAGSGLSDASPSHFARASSKAGRRLSALSSLARSARVPHVQVVQAPKVSRGRWVRAWSAVAGEGRPGRKSGGSIIVGVGAAGWPGVRAWS